MKKFILSLILAIWLIATPAYPIEPGLVNVTELDGVPTPWVYKLIFPNGTVTDNADGTVTIATGTGAGSGDFSSDTATSVDSELVLFKSTTGKLGKRATLTGLPYLTSGVLGTSKVTLTQPGTGSTLTILDGKTLTINKTMTLTGAGDTSVITLPAGAVSIPVFGTLTDTKYCTYSTASGLVCTSDGTAGNGDVATDTIWDAAGDLVIGTGANTAAKLTKGSANTILHMKGDGSTAEWTSWTILTPTTGGILYGTGTGVYTPLAKGTAGQILNMNAGATAPQWATDVGASTIVTVGALSAGSLTTGFTPVTVPLGGTGASTFALNGVLYGNAANAIGVTAIGTAGQILKVGADPFVPVWTSSITGITLGGFTASKALCSDGSGNAVACTNLTDVTPLVSGGALGTPASATLTNATGLPIAGLVASTSTALGVGSIELGHASDTTIARVGAGSVSVEGLTLPRIVATGQNALDFASTATAACATVIQVAATNAATTDLIIFTPNASIKAVTGFVPATTGGFTITAFPTAGYVNFEACNWTAGTVDPASITVNWMVLR